MPAKKRKAIILASIVLAILIIIGIVSSVWFLYLKTDMFKSNETLFAKYFLQNFNIVEMFKNKENSDIENILNSNKYTSNLEAKIEYVENIGTTNENKNSSINDVGIKIKSNVDKNNQYNYKDISVGTEETDLLKLEYINQDQNYGIRLNGILQFVSIDINQDEEILNNLGIENVNETLSNIDINSILNFSEEEKQNLINTYLNVIKANVPKEKYYKQAKSLITVNNKDMQANSYYIKLTIEEYNNLLIKILEQITQDEIILLKIDLIENEIKQRYSNDENDKSLREEFINTINNEIENIKNNNIGNDEIRITVYENNQKTVRTSIEKGTEKTNIDIDENSGVKIYCNKLGENIIEQSITIEKQNNSIAINYENVQDNNILMKLKVYFQESIDNDKINQKAEIEISNKNYKSSLAIINDIQLVQEFENRITLDNDNVKLGELQEEQLAMVLGLIGQNIQGQVTNLLSVVNLEDFVDMFKNLGIINKTDIQLPTESEVTENTKKRFNSQFEYFANNNLNQDNVEELVKIVENNLDDMKILLKSGEIEDFDLENLNKDDISEILFLIKKNSYNIEKKELFLKFLEGNSNKKYTVELQYDNDGLVNLVRIQIQGE